MANLKIYGIKCDKTHCNYRDMDVQFEDYPKYINKPCPLCGTSLLTQEEYDKCVKSYKVMGFLEKLKWINPFFYLNKLTGAKPETVEYTVPKQKRK
jgi:hypothetical protein